jgi:hypothetical protein
MRKIVWTFGLISGALLSVMMLITLPFLDRIGFEKGELIGYTSMVLAFLMVFFGVKSYRDNVGDGHVTFGRALVVGLLITVVATLCYVATWELIYYQLAPDFGDKYAAYAVAKAKASGASEAQIAETMKQMTDFREMYRNPLVNMALTFLEPLPVGVPFALLSAGILSRRRTAAGSR